MNSAPTGQTVKSRMARRRAVPCIDAALNLNIFAHSARMRMAIGFIACRPAATLRETEPVVIINSVPHTFRDFSVVGARQNG